MPDKKEKPEKKITGKEKRILESRDQFVTSEMQKAKGLRKITAGLRAAQMHKNKQADDKAKEDRRKGRTTLGGKALRFFGHEKSAKWYDRFLGDPGQEDKTEKKAEKTANRVISGVQATSSSIKVINRKLNMLGAGMADIQGDVTDIKQLLMPKNFVAKSKSGDSKAVQFNPLAPQGEQFKTVTEKGKLTPMSPGKDYMQSAIKKAAFESATLALKIQEKDKEKGELRKKRAFKDPNEFDPIMAEDPVNLMRVEMKKGFDDIKKREEEKEDGGIWSDIKDLIKNWRGLAAFWNIAKIIGKFGMVGLAAWMGYEIGTMIYDKLAPYILDAMEWAVEKFNAIKEWWNQLDVLKSIQDFFNPILAPIKKFFRIDSDEDIKKKEAKNAAEGRTRGGVASAKGPSMDQSIEHYDKMSRDEKATKEQRAAAAKARDSLIGTKMRTPEGVPTNIPTPEPSAPGPRTRPVPKKVAPAGTMRKEPEKPVHENVPSGATNGKQYVESEMDAAGISGPHRASLLAQIHHESNGFKAMAENLNYSADGLQKTFGKYFKSREDAEAYARNPEKIANKVYGGRMGNGPESSGDGYRYRGRGFIQLTGKDNYRQFGEMIGMDLVKNPDLAMHPAIAAKIAVAYYKKRVIDKGIRADDLRSVTKAVNGGTIGIEDRADKYAMYSKEQSSGTMVASTTTPAPGIPASTVDGQSRSLAAAKEAPVQVASVAAPVTVNNNNTTNKTAPRPLPKASATSKDDSLIRTASRDTQHPAYA